MTCSALSTTIKVSPEISDMTHHDGGSIRTGAGWVPIAMATRSATSAPDATGASSTHHVPPGYAVDHVRGDAAAPGGSCRTRPIR